MRFHKPIGTLLLLWPTLIALYLAAKGQPNLTLILIFCSGVIIMRAAGCVINDYADHELDRHVTRTKQRPLAAQQLAPQAALKLFIVLLALASCLALQLSFNTLLLAMVAASLTIIYPFMKRISGYPQFVLGLAFAWSIPIAYMQVNNKLSIETWLLFVSIMAWVIAYDTQYAMADKIDDLNIGIKSTAISFANYDKVIIFLLQVLCLIGFISLGIIKNFAMQFYLLLGLAFTLVLYQQWLIKDRLPARCMTAFLNNNYFGMLLFIACYNAVY